MNEKKKKKYSKTHERDGGKLLKKTGVPFFVKNKGPVCCGLAVAFKPILIAYSDA